MSKRGVSIQTAAAKLKAGELVAIPTETVYGLAANATNTEALLRIFEAKNRPRFDPLIVHVSGKQDLTKWTREVPTWALHLAENFWPGPLTLLLPKNDLIPDVCTSGLPRVALRAPKHELTEQLLKVLDFPLAAPSANPFGFVSPTTADHVEEQLHNEVAYILDGGPCAVGVESTIIGYEDEEPVVYRLGGCSVEDIQEVIGPVKKRLNQSSDPTAPGMLKSHYSPGIPLFVGDLSQLTQDHKHEHYALLTFKEAPVDGRPTEILSPSGSVHEAAHNLFSALRRLRVERPDLILAEWMPDEGLGRAINDRLRRAASQ